MAALEVARAFQCESRESVTLSPKSEAQLLLEMHMRELNFPFFPEYRFHSERKWRFDFAVPIWKLAIEIDGGIWRRNGGAHTGTGHIRDIEKGNAAVVLGWRTLRFTPDMIRNGDAKETLKQWLEAVAA